MSARILSTGVSEQPRRTFLLRTSSGRNIAAYGSIDLARAARDKRQADYPRPLVIVEQRVSERAVA